MVLTPDRGRQLTPADPITLIEQKIRVLTVEFERFFNGAIPVPPETLRDEIRAQLRVIRAAKSPSLEFTFRLNNVEARFNSFSEMFNRKMRNAGRRPPRVTETPAGTAKAASPKNVVVGKKPDAHSAERIYSELYAGDAKKPSFQAFEAFLAKQVQRIQKQTGCDRVSLRVSNDKGKARLRARPVEAN